MPHCVLKSFHPMVGVDLHIPWPPGSPSPAPAPAPYATVFFLLGTGLQSKSAGDHLSEYGLSMLKGTDIGMLIPHIGTPSVTTPVDMLVSASKSHFGSSRYKSKGTPVACALLVLINLNLNCGAPVPTPSGYVLALTTHMVDMSFADIAAGLATMTVDVAISALFSLAGGALGDKLKGVLQLKGASELLANVAGFTASQLFGFFLGGPMGADAGTLGFYERIRGKEVPADGGWTAGGGGSNVVSEGAEDIARWAASPLDGPEWNRPAQPLPGGLESGEPPVVPNSQSPG